MNQDEDNAMTLPADEKPPTDPEGDEIIDPGVVEGNDDSTVDADEAADAEEDTEDVDLQVQLEGAIAARQRAQADFLNYQKRAREKELFAEQNGRIAVVRTLLSALDHFDLALQQDMDTATVEQILDGMSMVRREISLAMESQGLAEICPRQGDPFDAHLHHALLRVPTADQEPDTVVEMMQSGYMFGETVLRPASVSIAAPEQPAEEEPAEAAPDDDSDGDDDADV